MKQLGYSQITGIDAAAKTLGQGSLGAIPAGTVAARLQAEGQNVRWRDDNVAPTAALGYLLLSAGTDLYYDNRLDRVQVIAAVTGAKVNVLFYGG